MTEPDQEAIYAAAGRCLAAWSGFERSLSELFLALHDQIPIPHKERPLRAAFECIQSFEVRLAMVNTTVTVDPRNAGLFTDRWNPFSNKISRYARKRAQVAHFTVVKHQHPDKPPVWKLHPFLTTGRLFELTSGDGDIRPITLDQLCARQDAFSRLAARTLRFSLFVQQKRGTFGTFPLQEADLAHLLDTETSQTPKVSG